MGRSGSRQCTIACILTAKQLTLSRSESAQRHGARRHATI
jgi:hypothetical protein